MIFDMKFIRICESEFLSIVIIGVIVISIDLVNRIVINTGIDEDQDGNGPRECEDPS